jgi:hypothetical protein
MLLTRVHSFSGQQNTFRNVLSLWVGIDILMLQT